MVIIYYACISGVLFILDKTGLINVKRVGKQYFSVTSY